MCQGYLKRKTEINLQYYMELKKLLTWQFLNQDVKRLFAGENG